MANASCMPKIELLIKRYGRKQLLLLNTSSKTVQVCPE